TMGANSSSLAELSSNEYLIRLCGKQPISSNDPYWNQLLSYAFVPPVTSTDAKLLEEQTANLLTTFTVNNVSSGNLNSLLRVLVTMVSNLQQFVLEPLADGRQSDIFLMQLYNALFISRCIIKHLVEQLSDELLLTQIEHCPDKQLHQRRLLNQQRQSQGDASAATSKRDLEEDDNSGDESDESNSSSEADATMVEELIEALVHLLVVLPVRESTFPVVYESVCSLLVLLSVQMYRTEPAEKLTFYQILYTGRCSMHAFRLMEVLLKYYVQRPPAPDRMLVNAGGSAGLYNSLASGLWSMVTLGYGSNPAAEQRAQLRTGLLADQSCLLSLVLANHCAGARRFRNPYREALLSCAHANDPGNVEHLSSAASNLISFRVDFNLLLKAICDRLPRDEALLMLYLLLHSAGGLQFRGYVGRQGGDDSQLAGLLLPILRTLHSEAQKSSHQVYMALIVLLMLTECQQFCTRVHEIQLQPASVSGWFTERHLGLVSLGSLLAIVLCRTVQLNVGRTRDKYLHTNCLAALANMSTYFAGLHPYACQKLLGLFAHLAKKQKKLVDEMRSRPANMAELEADRASVEDLMRCILEIVNNALTHRLAENPHLVYTQLHQRELYQPFSTHPAFQDILQNLGTVMHHFTSALGESSSEHQNQLSEHRVMRVIEERSRSFRRDRLKKFPEPKYKYVEEESPDEFFIPYIWALVYRSSNLYFNPSKLLLLQSQQQSESDDKEGQSQEATA
ncbi:hypothetical protein BOX15_Mlig005385g3, partial [Macrostomum lignano]